MPALGRYTISMFTPCPYSRRRAFAEEQRMRINSVQSGPSPYDKLLALRHSNGQEKALRFGRIRLSVFAAILCLMSLPACSYRAKHTLDIPEGPAPLTLKEFAKQANVEIVFKAASVGEIRTNAVHGLMTPEAALDVMLSGTSLQFDVDLETGAYAVTVIETTDTAGLSIRSILSRRVKKQHQ
jgi:hypothetical protein